MMLSAPPPIAKVGAWTLVDDNGKAFGSQNLAGKVYVADFMFTRCRSICLDLMKAMKEVESKTGRHKDALQFVSFSVDPAHDTPEKLRAYRKKFEAESARWTFVTGDIEAVHELIAKRMPFHVGEIEEKPAPENVETPTGDDAAKKDELIEIAHTGKLALFDQVGDLRAVFSTDVEGLAALGNAAALLITEGPNP